MIETTSQKFIVVLGVLVLLGILGYFLFNNAEVPVASGEFESEEVLGADILTLADKFTTISIDQSVFSSNIFLSLVDHSTPLLPEAQGRPNPFSQIGNDAVVSVGTQTTSTGL